MAERAKINIIFPKYQTLTHQKSSQGQNRKNLKNLRTFISMAHSLNAKDHMTIVIIFFDLQQNGIIKQCLFSNDSLTLL